MLVCCRIWDCGWRSKKTLITSRGKHFFIEKNPLTKNSILLCKTFCLKKTFFLPKTNLYLKKTFKKLLLETNIFLFGKNTFVLGSGYFASRGKIAPCYFAIWRLFAASAKIALSLMLTQTQTLTQTLTLILPLIPTLALTLTQTEEKHYFASIATSFFNYF